MTNKTQVVFIHGGMTFKNKRGYLRWLKTRKVSIADRIYWSDEYLKTKLGKRIQYIRLRMPNKDNAQYDEWKLYFERHIPLLKSNLILIGMSLGGMFLAKYLAENKFPKKIRAVYLVCPPFDDTLPDEDLAGGFKLKADLSKLEKSTTNLTLMFSKDDDVVPVSHARKFRNKLPNAKILIYGHIKGHFQLSKFPEIVRMIKGDVSKIRA